MAFGLIGVATSGPASIGIAALGIAGIGGGIAMIADGAKDIEDSQSAPDHHHLVCEHWPERIEHAAAAQDDDANSDHHGHAAARYIECASNDSLAGSFSADADLLGIV